MFFESIVRFAVTKRMFVALTTFFLLAGGLYAMFTLPVDAVPDITNNQVQVVTVSPTLAPQEVEQLITFPVEMAMSNVMHVKEIRSVSRFGLSVVTVVFEESVPILDARQLAGERLRSLAGEIPPELGTPELMPITTGVGEIYQYTLDVAPGYEERYDITELRTIQDWVVKRQLSGIPGVVEINSFGGYLKQYEVAVDPAALYALNITIGEVFEALSRNNRNTGGSYIEKRDRAYYIRSEGMIASLRDIEQIVVTNRGGIPIHVEDIAAVRYSAAKRFGAMTRDGKGECVGGVVLMLKGANAHAVTAALEERMEHVSKMLPAGVSIAPYLNRSELVDRNISTVVRNLVEGAAIVFLVLILFLGNVRAGLIVASVIPLAMLFAFICMRIFGVSANLMSLGAVDFGIVVDGSIVIVEGILAYLYGGRYAGRTLGRRELSEGVVAGAGSVVRSAAFAVLIILIVFLPILTLTGIEGKYFRPMAQTLVFCIVGALLLSLTYVPMMASLFLSRRIGAARTLADRFFDALNGVYRRCLGVCLRFSRTTVAVAFAALAGSLVLFSKLGAEFIPTLDEGDFVLAATLPPGSSLTSSIEMSQRVERLLLDHFPEVEGVVAKIGTAEVPTDPMGIEEADMIILMKPFGEWTSARTRAGMMARMKQALDTVPDLTFNFSQPIQLRFNELMTGVKSDIAVKLYGEDMAVLYAKAREAAQYVRQVPGAGDVYVEQTMGLPQLVVRYDRARIARYGVNIDELNTVVRTAYAGEAAGTVFENERRFDLAVRLDRDKVRDLNLDRLFVRTADGLRLPVSEVASIELVDGPLQIIRDAAKRRVVIGVNVRDADTRQVVEAIRRTLDEHVQLDAGYYFVYGGQFENLQNAVRTLAIVTPAALMLILLLLFFAFRSVTYTLVVFSTVPLSLIGGIVALWLRGLPFSISAGVGFIALFGVAVLNGILMIDRFNTARDATRCRLSTSRVIARETPHLLRPVFLTGLVASLGFVPMAVATTAGAEVQRPLATVVIGGLVVSTVFTLIVVPVFYRLVGMFSTLRRRPVINKFFPFLFLLLFAAGAPFPAAAQRTVTLDEAIAAAVENNPRLRSAEAAAEQVRAMRGEAWELGPTTVEYARGQLNGLSRRDHQITVTQSLGSLLTPFYRNALVRKQVATESYRRELVRREIVAEVKRAWVYYLYTLRLCSIYRSQSELSERLRSVTELRYAQGDISLLERNMTAALAAEMANRAVQAGEEHRLAASRLQWVCHTDEALVPADTTLVRWSAPVRSATVPAAYLNYFNSLVERSEARIGVERSRLFPELSVGFQRQNILPDKGLNAWTVSLSVPLFFQGQRSRIRQARIGARIAEWEAHAELRALERRITELETALERGGRNIRYYETQGLAASETLLHAADRLLAAGDAGIAEVVQSLNSALEIRRGYAEALHNYNIAVLEYELFR